MLIPSGHTPVRTTFYTKICSDVHVLCAARLLVVATAYGAHLSVLPCSLVVAFCALG